MPYSREPLSGSTHGKGIKIAATASPGTTVHTGQASATNVDVVTLYAVNSTTAVRTVTLQWGGTATPDDDIVIEVPAKGSGPYPLVVDQLIRNSLAVLAYCDQANVVTIHGFINKGS